LTLISQILKSASLEVRCSYSAPLAYHTKEARHEGDRKESPQTEGECSPGHALLGTRRRRTAILADVREERVLRSQYVDITTHVPSMRA
jgi:hypothetical protein